MISKHFHDSYTSIWDYLESSSNKKELLTAVLDSSVIKTLILEITYISKKTFMELRIP